MTQLVKNQHYVPRSYLKEWCIEDQIRVFDKITGKSFHSNKKDVAATNYFYDTSETRDVTNPETLQCVEKWFSDKEGKAKQQFDNVRDIARKVTERWIDVPPSSEHKFDESTIDALCEFASIQMLRVAHFRDDLRSSWNYLMKRILDEVTPELFPASEPGEIRFDAVAEDFLTAFHVEFLRTRMDKMAKSFKEKLVVVCANKSGLALVTSDNPVILLGTIVDESVPHDGLNSPAIQIAYPISPDVCVKFYHPVYFKQKVASNWRVHPMPRQEVVDNNKHQLFQANRQVFAGKDSDLNFARNCFLNNEYDRDPRKRIKPETYDELLADIKAFARLIGPGYFTQESWRRLLQHENPFPIDYSKFSVPKRPKP